MIGATADIQVDFAAILGESQVSGEPAVCAAFAIDTIAPKCVVYPACAEEVAEVLKCASGHGLAVIPVRNGTKLGMGVPPRRYDVALSLKDMNQVWYYEPDDLVVSVEPGMKFGDLQHFLARHNLWVPLDPVGGERASVGGILAANSAGPLRLHYGGPRDLVLGMKIVTAEGAIVKTGGRVVKNVAGYDLAKLLIGSYGTLGVIVEASFKLHPLVAERATWVIETGTLAAAREFRRALLRSPLTPLRMALLNGAARVMLEGNWGHGSGVRDQQPATTMPESSLDASSTPPVGPAIWIEAGGSERVLARYAQELGALAQTIKASVHRLREEQKAGWDRISDFGSWMTKEQGVPVVVKAALPIASSEEFLERAEEDAEGEGWLAIGLAQPGVGVVEVGLMRGTSAAALNPEPRTPPAGRSPSVGEGPSHESQAPSPGFIHRLREIARDLGGSLVVTRCPAELKPKIDVWGPPGDDFEVMGKLKAAWDPKGTLSPGRFVGRI
ncbi:MAG TPA: FAD-binding oxidoreductase [Terriglobia bacterium]|nr:FAD-binding oxidoreductase [Terriglobia bacterium]